MSLSLALTGVMLLAGPQPAEKTEAVLRAAPLMVAHGFCLNNGSDDWERLEAGDPYADAVRAYWDAAGEREGTKYTQIWLRGIGKDGEYNGTYLQHVMVGTERSGQHSCIVHFPDRDPPPVGPAELELFAGNESEAREKLIPLLPGETTWEVTLPEGHGYDLLSISTFAPLSASAKHPFRGTQYRFLKLGAL